MTTITSARRLPPDLMPRARAMLTGGTMVVLATVAASNLLRVASSMILTRLLDASAFGIIGIVNSISFVMVMLGDLTIVPYVVRHAQGGDPRFLDQVWTLRLARSVVVTAVLAALAGGFARYTGHAELRPVLVVYSLYFLLDGLSSLAVATAVREGQLRRLSALDLLSNLFQVAVSIVLALWWRNYWALVWAILAGQAMKALLSYAAFPHALRRFAPSGERARELWGFSRFLMISSVLTLVISQTDKFVLSPLLPLALFGLYSVATTLATAPQAVIGTYVSRILLPAYAAAYRESPATLAATYYARKRLVTLAYMAGVGGLIGVAPLLVAILYDPRYAGVAFYLRLLALVSLLMFNNAAATEALIGAGRNSIPLHGNFARIGWLVGLGGLAFALGHPVWIIGVVSTIEVPATLFFWWALRRIGVLDLRQEALELGVALIGGLAGWGVSSAVLALHAF